MHRSAVPKLFLNTGASSFGQMILSGTAAAEFTAGLPKDSAFEGAIIHTKTSNTLATDMSNARILFLKLFINSA